MPSRKAGFCGDFEGQRRRIDVMVFAVDQREAEIDRREAGEHAGIGLDADAFFDGWDVFLRHRAADDLVLELDARVALQRLEDDLHFRILARTARTASCGCRFPYVSSLIVSR